MKSLIAQLIVLLCGGFSIFGQSGLQFFTNQANSLLRTQFGFGITNIPVYCPTNPAAAYNASIHYALQSATNAYDATTPSTNLPSVFRPLFGWQGGTLFITGYTSVSNNFFTQTAPGFKTLNDPSISTNDNVWGIPWVVGAKGQIPAFNEYCYSSEINVMRDLYFVRAVGPGGLALTNVPPRYTNQFYIMSISNLFGSEFWNSYPTSFNRPVILYITNQISISFTNNYDGGMTTNIGTSTNQLIPSFPSWNGSTFSPSGFYVPPTIPLATLPLSYWSEVTHQFIPWGSGSISSYPSSPLPADWEQLGWPVHQWTLNITNNLACALIDDRTRQVLDFINLGAFGSSIDIQAMLENYTANGDVWGAAPATDEPYSPPSLGMQNQIIEGVLHDPSEVYFIDSLMGLSPCYSTNVLVFANPYQPYAAIVQNCSWQAKNPLVHYTVQDLTQPQNVQQLFIAEPSEYSLSYWLSNSAYSLGKINPRYTSGAISSLSYGVSNGLFQLGACGTPDLPYEVWASTNLIDWNPLGTPTQPSPGSFQFQDTTLDKLSESLLPDALTLASAVLEKAIDSP